MFCKSILFGVAVLLATMTSAAEEFDAVVNDATRAFTKQADSPDKLSYGRLTLDSKGHVVRTIINQGKVTSQTKVAMGTFDEKTKKWMPGEAIEGGLGAELFLWVSGTVVRGAFPVAHDLCRGVSPVGPEELLFGPKVAANEKVRPPPLALQSPPQTAMPSKHSGGLTTATPERMQSDWLLLLGITVAAKMLRYRGRGGRCGRGEDAFDWGLGPPVR